MHPQKQWRDKTGVSQLKLSRATGPTRKELRGGAKGELGVDQGLISKIEQGTHLPGLEAAFRLCIATAKLSSIVEPLRVSHYAPRELAMTYSQIMEDWYGLAKGTAAQAADRGEQSKRKYAKKTAQEAVSATNKPKRTRGGGGRRRKAAKAAKAKASKR